jgi:hypothetical protein
MMEYSPVNQVFAVPGARICVCFDALAETG